MFFLKNNPMLLSCSIRHARHKSDTDRSHRCTGYPCQSNILINKGLPDRFTWLVTIKRLPRFSLYVSAKVRGLFLVSIQIRYVKILCYQMRGLSIGSIDVKVLRINDDDDDNGNRRMRYESAGIIKAIQSIVNSWHIFLSFSLSLSLSPSVSRERETRYLLAGGWTLQLLMFMSASAGLPIRRRVPRSLAKCIGYPGIIAIFLDECSYTCICKTFDNVFTRTSIDTSTT